METTITLLAMIDACINQFCAFHVSSIAIKLLPEQAGFITYNGQNFGKPDFIARVDSITQMAEIFAYNPQTRKFDSKIDHTMHNDPAYKHLTVF